MILMSKELLYEQLTDLPSVSDLRVTITLRDQRSLVFEAPKENEEIFDLIDHHLPLIHHITTSSPDDDDEPTEIILHENVIPTAEIKMAILKDIVTRERPDLITIADYLNIDVLRPLTEGEESTLRTLMLDGGREDDR